MESPATHILIEKSSEDAESFERFLEEIESLARTNRDHNLLLRLERVRMASGVLNISRKMCCEYLDPFIRN